MRAMIAAIVKDEHRDIREWVDYHFGLDFDRIVLYDNNSSRDYSEELSGLPIEWRRWETNEDHRQIHVYDHFLASEEWSDIDWCAFIDPDEFIVLDGETIKEFLSDHADTGGVALSWRCYGADGRVARPDLPVRQAYRKPAPKVRDRHNFKSIVPLSQVSHWADVHRAIPKTGSLVNTRREPIYCSEVAEQYARARIDHYITKSWADYVERLKRGNITKGIRKVWTFFAYNPDMAPLAHDLVSSVNFDEFPTISDGREQERLERLNRCFEASARLDAIADGVVPHRQFMEACAAELIGLAVWRLAREPDPNRLRPRFYDLIQKQLAFFERVPLNFNGYYETIISNLISTPFDRIARQA